MSVRLNPDLIPNLLDSIEQSRQNEAIATEQLSSGRAVNQISDNPSDAAALVLNHDQASQDAQFQQNLTVLQGRYQVADSALSNATTAMTRASSLAVEGANGTLSPSDRQAIAGEVQGILNQMLSLANTSYQGAYIFAGTAVTTQPFSLDANTKTVNYAGNDQTSKVQLSNGISMTANMPGDQLFLNASGSALQSLQDLYTALTTGTNLPAAVTEVQNGLNQLTGERVFYGNALNQISSSESFLSQDTINLSQQENTLVGADMPSVATNFAQAQVATQATISAASQILQQKTLLDYIA
jgi:flagellar hook-associated protein 3 FlgL